MKRMIALIAAAALLLALVCGCAEKDSGAEETPPPASDSGAETPPEEDAPGGQPSKPDTAPAPSVPDAPAPDIPAPAPGPAQEPDALPSGWAYIEFYDYWLPLSVIKEGQSLLSGDEWWYFDTQAAAQALGIGPAEDAELYDIPGGAEDSVCPRLAVSGWDPITTESAYTPFTPEHQPDAPDWDEYFSSLLADYLPETDTPVFYTGCWRFDIDGDGLDDYFVNACNFLDYTIGEQEARDGVLPAQNPPDADNTLLYSCTALFLGDGEIFDIASDMFTMENGAAVTSEENSARPDAVFYSYRVDAASSQYTQCIAFSYQYDSRGHVTACPIYSLGEFGALCSYSPAAADVTGDGEPELITWGSTIYAPITVFSFQRGMPELTLRFWSPA